MWNYDRVSEKSLMLLLEQFIRSWLKRAFRSLRKNDFHERFGINKSFSLYDWSCLLRLEFEQK